MNTQVIIRAILTAMSSLDSKHPNVGVWLPEATVARLGGRDEQADNKHFQQWFSRIVAVAGNVNVGWVHSVQFDENGMMWNVAECYLALAGSSAPNKFIGKRYGVGTQVIPGQPLSEWKW